MRRAGWRLTRSSTVPFRKTDSFERTRHVLLEIILGESRGAAMCVSALPRTCRILAAYLHGVFTSLEVLVATMTPFT
jgi:hypothetical protein